MGENDDPGNNSGDNPFFPPPFTVEVASIEIIDPNVGRRYLMLGRSKVTIAFLQAGMTLTVVHAPLIMLP